jgi:hypothetical protein
MIEQGDFLFSVDLKDGYHLVELDPEFSRLCGFRFEGQTYLFRVLPFGLSWAPMVFTKLWRPVLGHAQSHGIRLSAFIDDFLGMGSSHKQGMAHLRWVLRELTRLGAVISDKKPIVVSQEVEHLGLVVNTVAMTLRLTERRIGKIESLCREAISCLCNERPLPPRLLLKLQGTCSSAMLGLDGARSHSRVVAFVRREGTLPTDMKDAFLEELQWWLAQVRANPGRPIHAGAPRWRLTVDASDLGAGGELVFLQSRREPVRVALPYLSELSTWPQAHRELYGLHRCVEALAPFLQGPATLAVRTDSVFTKAACMNGSHSSREALWLTRNWLRLTESLQLRVLAVHLPGTENFLADALSRQNSLDEWPACRELVRYLELHFNTQLSLDLFGSALHHLDGRPYVTHYCKDLDAAWTDAFSKGWSDLRSVWMAPPVRLLPAVVRTLECSRPRFGLLLHPVHPAAWWYQRLLGLRSTHMTLPDPWTHRPFGSHWGAVFSQSAGVLGQWRWAVSVLQTCQP